ncbi:MAG: hypothetical protein RLO52_06970 [Sandaracinaceae bacterium]
MPVAQWILLVLGALTAAGCDQCRNWGEDPWVPGQVVVGFDEDITIAEVEAINEDIGASIEICYPVHYCTMRLPAGVGISEALCFYDGHPRVRFALPNSYVSSSSSGDAGL